MRNRVLMAAGAAALGLVMTAAYADYASARGGYGPDGMRDGRGGRIFERLDTDGDGKVSRSEFAASFDKLDRDGDGYVTREEVQALRDEKRAERRELMFRHQDINGDGKIALEEFTGPARFFARLDADHDGYITEQEAQDFRPARDGWQRGGRGCWDGGRRAPGPGPDDAN